MLLSGSLLGDVRMCRHKHAKFYVYDTSNRSQVKKFMYDRDEQGVVRTIGTDESEISEAGSSSEEP